MHTRCTTQVRRVKAIIYHKRASGNTSTIRIIRDLLLQKSLPYGEGQLLKFTTGYNPDFITGTLIVKLVKDGRSLMAKAKLKPTRFRLSKNMYTRRSFGSLSRDCKVKSFRTKPKNFRLSDRLNLYFRYECNRTRTVRLRVFRIYANGRVFRLRNVSRYTMYKGRAKTVTAYQNFSARLAGGHIELHLSSRNSYIRYRRKIVPYRWRFIPLARTNKRPRPQKR